LVNKKIMKKILIFSIGIYSGTLMAQPKIITQATIQTTTNIIAPDEEDVANIQPQGGGGGGAAMFRNFGDGETKSVTQVKNDMIKTVIKSDMGRSTIIRNNASKLTTTLLEMMGNKTGFYVTDEEQAALRKRMDSMMLARTKDSAANPRRSQQEVPVEVSITDETKKIAGYNCKKAYLISTRFLGVKDTAIVWYTPEIKITNLTSTGGGFNNGGMSMGNSNSGNQGGLSQLDGFVMRYETKMRRNRLMIVEVTKIDLTKEIADKEFNIPKDFELKPMKEMGNMMGGGQGNQFQIRRNN
jgi:hypothetical protein